MRPTKADIRNQARSYRQDLSPEDRRRASRIVCETVLKEFLVSADDTANVYWPIDRNGELDTRPLIRALSNVGVRITIPSVAPIAGFDSAIMVCRTFASSAEMVSNEWGTREPMDGAIVPLAEHDLIIVPALAADERGYRIGYGGGFYDRFLQNASCQTVVLVYSKNLLSRVETDEHDIPVTAVVTESCVFRP